MSTFADRSTLFPPLGAFILALLFCVGIMVMMSKSQSQPQKMAEEVIILRPLRIAPPPPPEIQTSPSKIIPPQFLPTLSNQSNNAKVILETASLDMTLEVDYNAAINTDNNDFKIEMDIQDETKQALSMDFKFEDMDEPVHLLHHRGFSFTFPKDLLRKGVNKGTVELLIEIDVEGKARVLSVVSAKYDALVSIAERMVTMSQFTPPTVHGKKAKTTGIWPVHLQGPR